MDKAIPSIETDPCKRTTMLREIRDKVITGGAMIEFDHETGNGVRRRARFGPADMARLDRLIAEAEEACKKARGVRGRPRRFAIGHRTRRF